jgi:hypothetical protein
VKTFVLRLAFAAVLLMLSSVICDLARGQSQAAPPELLAADARPEPVYAPAPMRSLESQFPATNASLIAETPLDHRSSFSIAISDLANLSAFTTDATLDAYPPAAEAIPPRPAKSASAAASKPKPKTYYNENPNKWQLGLAFALVRFRSSVYYASAPGLNSSLAYWWKDWVAIEGSVTSAFAPPVFANEHFRYLGYGAGPKFLFGHGRLEPWAHGLVGGVHLIPQTGNGGRNGAEFTLGGGVDYLINDVISAKGGVDYLGTHMFGEWQSSVQIVAGLSLRF